MAVHCVKVQLSRPLVPLPGIMLSTQACRTLSGSHEPARTCFAIHHSSPSFLITHYKLAARSHWP